ncbi:MAG: sterol desaturase family protein [Sphingobacteriales bacterium]|nr:sterol desaturase family protein [Sphingobacteriales bacterium]MBI3720472.1 sterol desaturase family protein [Sphingobacteriales bacterium]
MYQLKHYITENGHQLQLWVFIALFIVTWNIENFAGMFLNYKKWKHAFINAPFILTSIPGQLLLGLAFIKTIEWTTQHQFGLLYLFPANTNPAWLFILSFVLLDFGEYGYHVIMHKVKRLWMFHAVHHSDNVVDVSTTLREHPGENIVRLSFTLLWVIITGTAFWMLMLRQIVQAITTLFAHMNYRFSDNTDKLISLLFVTPNLHQVHHHYKQPYTDCNYGDVLSIWDRMFGTLRRLPADQLIFGVDTYMHTRENANFYSLFKIPFGKYRKANIEDENATKTILK